MTIYMPRWTAGGLSLWEATDGPYVLATDAEAAVQIWKDLAAMQGGSYREGVEWGIQEGRRKVIADYDGQSVILASEADAMAMALDDERERAILDCIAVVEHLHDYEAPHDAHRDALWNAIMALRALLEEKP